MKKNIFTVGPSQLYPTAKKHIKKALDQDITSMLHRGDDFHSLFTSTTESIRSFLKVPKTHSIYYLSSATECMERTLESCVHKECLHIVTGAFGKKFFDMAKDLNKHATHVEIEDNFEKSLNSIKVPKKTELIMLTQNDTSTGAWIPTKYIEKIKTKYPDKLVAIDVVSSAPVVDINFSKTDITLFSVQKGFGLPAGLGVLIVSPQAESKAQLLRKTKKIPQSYHSFYYLKKYSDKFQTFETPNVLNLYLLKHITNDMMKKGAKKLETLTNKKAQKLYQYIEKSKIVTPVVEEKNFQSQTTIVVSVKGGSKKLLEFAKKKNMYIGAGYGPEKNNHIRIANFPSHTNKQISDLIKVLGDFEKEQVKAS